MKKILIATFAVLLLLTGCKQIPKLENGKEAVVSLSNGKSISVDELYAELKDKYALNVLIDMIDTRILDGKYETNDETKTYVKNNIDLTKTYYTQYYNQAYATYEAFIAENYGVTTNDELEAYFTLRYKRSQAVKDYAKSKVTENEINSYYKDELIGDIEASHILITANYETDDQKEAAEKEALNKAKEVIAKLDAGEDFAKLAKEYSKDGSSSNGGALGRFSHGDMVEEFESAAYKLEEGKYTKEPVKTRYGYHIILKTKQYEKPELDKVKDEIIETLAERKLNEDSTLSATALEKLRDDSGLSIEDSELKTKYDNYLYNLTK